MATENKVTGKYYRILKDKANDIWDRISIWTHADDVETSSGITLTSDLNTKGTKISATQSDFATIESSSVAAHSYIKGNLLVYNNQLYRAKTAIAVGNTLTVGTNIEAVNVGTLSDMLTASNGNAFYFDVKNGQYGFYPTASKTSSEFVPFGGTGGLNPIEQVDAQTLYRNAQQTVTFNNLEVSKNYLMMVVCNTNEGWTPENYINANTPSSGCTINAACSSGGFFGYPGTGTAVILYNITVTSTSFVIPYLGYVYCTYNFFPLN